MSASGESSTTMDRLLHASGSHPIPSPDDPKEHSLLSPPSQPINPSSSSSHRWLSSLAVRGFDLEVISSRRSRVLALMVRAARVAVVLGLSFAAFVMESILPRSV
ncbi:hypothetical protein F511_23834 [Dorcoceras hygrometricum]|uniref:Uncharacterized protein n=1 Tax=Dorcoceras hygrometricum TaxID=472368 RepID=A0A2Z7D7M2_9LAMI|nr:hypothetical protein F511_23834 [Dorcoceras hygrometricum]